MTMAFASHHLSFDDLIHTWLNRFPTQTLSCSTTFTPPVLRRSHTYMANWISYTFRSTLLLYHLHTTCPSTISYIWLNGFPTLSETLSCSTTFTPPVLRRSHAYMANWISYSFRNTLLLYHLWATIQRRLHSDVSVGSLLGR